MAPVSNAGIFAGVVVAHLVAVVGCYRPELADCRVSCTEATDCADGQRCRDGWCMSAGALACGASETVDGNTEVTTDGSTPPPDVQDLCPQGCTNGTCDDNGVCVIDCTADSACPNDVTCPPNIPCRVECGLQACGHKVICGLAASCEVVCAGDYSCKDEVICNANRCDVTCSGTSACARRIKCAASCACDVSCSGTDSCRETNECPAATCRLGEGCSSQLAGCSTCS